MAADSPYRVQAAVEFAMRTYLTEGHAFAPLEELSLRVGALLELGSAIISDVLEDMVFEGRLQLAEVEGKRVVYVYGYYKAECTIAGKLAAMANPPKGLVKVCANAEAMLRKAEGETGIALSAQQKKRCGSPCAVVCPSLPEVPAQGKQPSSGLCFRCWRGAASKQR